MSRTARVPTARVRTATFATAALAGTLLAAGPGLADCPATQDDAVRGIVVTMEDGSVATIKRDPATGVVREVWQERDRETPSITDALHGVHLLLLGDDDGSGAPVAETLEEYRFASPPPLPAPGQTWSSPVQILRGEDVVEASYGAVSGPAAEMVIGTCRYAAIRVTVQIREPDYTSLDQVEWLPALGIGLLTAAGEFMGETTSFVPVSIAKVP